MADEEAAAGAGASLTRRESQGYSYACQRAELLGMPAPTQDEWLASEDRAKEREAEELNAHDDAVAQELDGSDEGMRRIGGGLDELNTILSATQKKINKFKNVCSGLGTLLKARVGSQPGTPEHKMHQPSGSEEGFGEEQLAGDGEQLEGEACQRGSSARKADLNSKVGSHLDKLDSLISKADAAQCSMQHQTKQMKSFLK